MAVFSLITPLGIGIGIALTENDDAELHDSSVAILNGLAAGTLIYVVFFEVLEKERQKKTNGLFQVTFIVLGFVTMICVQMIEGEHHHHHGGHHDEKVELCQLDIGEFAAFKSVVNVTCHEGVLTVA